MRVSNRLKLLAMVGAVLLAGSGCESQERADARREAVDTLTQRQRDSLLGTLPVPGAGAIGRAMRAADSASSRARQHDTIR